MWLILEAIPKGAIRRSVPKAEAADGARVTVGTQSSRRSASHLLTAWPGVLWFSIPP